MPKIETLAASPQEKTSRNTLLLPKKKDMMKFRPIFCCLLCLWFCTVTAFAQKKYTLSHFYTQDSLLTKRTEQILGQMNQEEMAGQMIIQAVGKLGKKTTTVQRLIQKHQLGGIILLSGEKKSFQKMVHILDSTATASRSLPILYSADAEPSLVNRKIKGTRKVRNTSEIKTVQQCRWVASSISKDLLEMGVRQNFAPICDLSTANQAIGNRSFGSNPDSVALLADAFIQFSQQIGVAATAKHFPGHGFVKGDTHHELVYIDGELKETDVYKPLIARGVVGIMVAHIAVRNNPLYDTKGLPASCSEVIVKKLLKETMGFKGLAISDAMNMKAATNIPQASLKAAMAGCDMILMPPNETEAINSIVEEMNQNEQFRKQIHESVKKIIRLKICLGLIY
jgi:beta-N-acetylhexosaminidase